LTPTEFQALKDIILHQKLWLAIEIVEKDANFIRQSWEQRVSSLLKQQAKAFKQKASQGKSRRTAFTGQMRDDFRVLLNETRYYIVELQFSQLQIEKSVSELLTTPNTDFPVVLSAGVGFTSRVAVRDNAAIAFSTSTALPDLPGKKPLQMKLSTPEEWHSLQMSRNYDLWRYLERHRMREYPPTAQELIDGVQMDPDPRHAIRVMQKALRLGHDLLNFERSSTYIKIALRYEDLGNHGKVIEYLTKAEEEAGILVVGPYELFSRGRAYFHLGDFPEARVDIERSLALGLGDPKQDLMLIVGQNLGVRSITDEREEALKLLEEIARRCVEE
jgi:tetratricopeptide (TPR) repeat protein